MIQSHYVGNSSKEGRGYTKTSLNSGTCLEVARPRKSIPTLCPLKRGNSLGNVNSKVRIWAPACSLLIQETRFKTSWGWPPCLRNLAATAIMIEDALKLSFGGKLTIFTSHQVKQLLNGKSHLWMSDQRILRYPVMLMENPGLTIYPCEVINPATLLPTPEGSLPFHSCLETLDHWTNPERDCRKILWPILRKSGTLMAEALSWMEKEEPSMQWSPILRP